MPDGCRRKWGRRKWETESSGTSNAGNSGIINGIKNTGTGNGRDRTPLRIMGKRTDGETMDAAGRRVWEKTPARSRKLR